jgi:hypothetical protein
MPVIVSMSNYVFLQFAASVPVNETPSEVHSEDVAIATINFCFYDTHCITDLLVTNNDIFYSQQFHTFIPYSNISNLKIRAHFKSFKQKRKL